MKAMARVREIRDKRERVFYKKRMAGNKERQMAADRKLVAENSHLLPRMRGSERLALEKADGVVEEVEVRREKAKVFGKMQQRLKVRIDGEVEEDGMDID